MTTIQSLRLMAEGNASLTSEETYVYLTRAASELSALQRSLNGIKQEAKGYKDDHLKCVHWCCENGLGESTDNATDEVLKQLSALQKENAELKNRLGAPRRMYPIAGGQSVPFEVMIPFESASQSNHSQSINRIAERGGFSPEEAWAIVNNLKWRQIMVMGLPEAARQWDEYATRINQHYAELDSLRTQNRELREILKVKDEALEELLGHRQQDKDGNYVMWIGEGTFLKCEQALALQPEK